MLNRIPFLFKRVLNIKNSLFFKFKEKKKIRIEVEEKIEIIKERINLYEEMKFLLKREDKEIIDIISVWYLEVKMFKRKYKWNEFMVEKLVKS